MIAGVVFVLLPGNWAAAELPPVVDDRLSEQWRSQIRDALFVPEVLPKLASTQHGQFTPAPGITAERVT